MTTRRPPERRAIDLVVDDTIEDMTAAFAAMSEQVAGIIVSAASSDGTINPDREEDLQERIGDLVQRFFTVNRRNTNIVGRSSFNGVQALSRFAEILNRRYVQAVGEQVAIQYRWLRDNLPDDVFRFLSTAQTRQPTISEAENPFLRRDGESLESFLERMDDLRIFRPNPLAELDPDRQWVPMHQWNDDRGYRLSDRVWQGGVRTRTKIDAILAESIREGRSALETAKLLEQFLRPDRENLRTNKPYGVNASYDAMRLARTEIARAANYAAFTSAYLNPYVDKVDVRRSANGDPKCRICPMHATIGIGGNRIRPPYSIHSANVPVYHPHCKCILVPVVTDSPEAVTERLRAIMQDAEASLVQMVTTPAQMQLFVEALVGWELMNLLGQVIQLPLL